MKTKKPLHIELSPEMKKALDDKDTSIFVSNEYLFQRKVDEMVIGEQFKIGFVDLLKDSENIAAMQGVRWDQATESLVSTTAEKASAETNVVPLPVDEISEATVVAYFTGNIRFFVSNDDGETFEHVIPGSIKKFNKKDNRLKVYFVFLDEGAVLDHYAVLAN